LHRTSYTIDLTASDGQCIEVRWQRLAWVMLWLWRIAWTTLKKLLSLVFLERRSNVSGIVRKYNGKVVTEAELDQFMPRKKLEGPAMTANT